MISAASWLLLLVVGLAVSRRLGVARIVERLVFAGTTASAAVVGVMLALGVTGMLGRGAVIGATIVVAACGALFAARGGPAQALAGLRGDAASLSSSAARLLRHPEITALAALAAIVWAWAVAAAWVLPPRSIDDLSHHLTPVLESIARGRLALVPTDYRPWVAYPLDADLLFGWHILANGGMRGAALAQCAAGLFAAAAAVALARRAGASRRAAASAGLLFALMPVAVRQAPSCYTDLVLAAWFGAMATGIAAWIEDGGVGDLVLAGTAAGLLAGTKYNMLYALVLLVPLAVAGRRQAWRRTVIAFAIPALVFAVPWYARNLLVLGNPFYPYRVGLGPVTLFPSSIVADAALFAGPSLLGALPFQPQVLARLFFADPGNGSIDGGFGAVFWAAALPVALWSCLAATRDAWRRRTVRRLAVPLAAAAGILVFLVTHLGVYTSTVRFLLGAAVPAFALLAVAIERLRRDWTVACAAVWVAAIGASVAGLLPLGGASDRFERKQLMRLGAAANASDGRSPWLALSGAEYGIQRHAAAWDMLERLTAPVGEKPLSLWIYATGPYPPGLYGWHVQNRVWNLAGPDRPAQPDVLFFYFGSPPDPRKTEYYGAPSPAYPFEQASLQPDRWELVFTTAEIAIYVRRDLLSGDLPLRARLARYYESAEPGAVALARSLEHAPAGTIVAPPPAGYGLKAMEFENRLSGRVVIARAEQRDEIARALGGGQPVLVAARASEQLTTPVVAHMRAGSEVWELHAAKDAP